MKHILQLSSKPAIVIIANSHLPVFSEVGTERKYGGIEAVIANSLPGLSEFEVHLFAAGDPPKGLPYVKFHQTTDTPLHKQYPDNLVAREFAALRISKQILKKIDQLGLSKVPIINHAEVTLVAADDNLPNLNIRTIVHNNLKDPYRRDIYMESAGTPLVSISKSQRNLCPGLNFVENIYNGTDVKSFDFVPDEGKYLVFMGRITPDKGPDLAARLAIAANIPIHIAGIVDIGNEEFYKKEILSLRDQYPHLIHLVGEIGHEQKKRLLGGALAIVVLNYCWEEPFGLMMIEAMSCGTPVIGTDLGSIPEVIENVGVTIPHTKDKQKIVQAAVEALPRINNINRADCRKRVEEYFSLEIMGQNYAKLCNQMLSSQKTTSRNLRVVSTG